MANSTRKYLTSLRKPTSIILVIAMLITLLASGMVAFAAGVTTITFEDSALNTPEQGQNSTQAVYTIDGKTVSFELHSCNTNSQDPVFAPSGQAFGATGGGTSTQVSTTNADNTEWKIRVNNPDQVNIVIEKSTDGEEWTEVTPDQDYFAVDDVSALSIRVKEQPKYVISFTGVTDFTEFSNRIFNLWYSTDDGIKYTIYDSYQNSDWFENGQGSNPAKLTIPSNSSINAIKIEPRPGYSVQYSGNNVPLDQSGFCIITHLPEGGCNITISQNGNQGQGGQLGGEGSGPIEPEFNPTFDITIAGVGDFTDIGTNSVIKDDNIDIANLEFEITKLHNQDGDEVLTNCKNKGYTSNAEGKNPLEIRVIAKTANSITINMENHDSPQFYFTNITFANDKYVGVQISSNEKPFMFDSFVAGDIADVSSSTPEKPAEFNTYYDSNVIEFENVAEQAPIVSIVVAPEINPSAVTIENLSVKVNSNFYDKIPLIITFEDGSKGYININRIGIEIAAYEPNANNNKIFHGTQNGSSLQGTKYEGKYNITGTFYFSYEKSYTDYDLVSTATFSDGHTEVSVVSGFAETPGDPGFSPAPDVVEYSLKAGDYVLWSGDKKNAPVSVSVTAVPAGTFSADTFGGATFGSGKGVTMTFTDR